MTNTISRVNTFFTKLPFPSSITAVITNTCTSVAAFTSCIALFFTVYSKVVFITFFWKREKKTLQSIKTTFYHKKTLIIWENFHLLYIVNLDTRCHNHSNTFHLYGGIVLIWSNYHKVHYSYLHTFCLHNLIKIKPSILKCFNLWRYHLMMTCLYYFLQ